MLRPICAVAHLAIASISMLLAGEGAAADKKAEKITLEGKWELVTLTDGGKAWTFEGKRYLVIAGDKISFHKDKGPAAASDTPPIFRETTAIKIDTTKRPLAIDLVTKQKDLSLPGIFEFVKEGQLTMCFYDTKRPADFTSTKENGNILIVLHRVKN